METVLIDEVVSVIVEEPKILEQINYFGRVLGVKYHKLTLLSKLLHTEGYHEILYKIVEDFVTTFGNKATVQKLCDHVQEFGCISGVGML